ncbi:KAT8 regulatory NSL complex subunit 1 [Gastrophryne carolinensis]
MAAMAPALTDPAPDAHNLHFKLAPPSSSLPLGETNGGCLPPPAPPDLVTGYGGAAGKEALKLGGVYTPRSILSQSLCRGRTAILDFNLEELRGIANSNRGGQGGPLNGLAKRPAKPAVDKPPSLSIPALEPWVKAPPVPSGSPAEEHDKSSCVENGSEAHFQSLLRRHGEMEKRARSIQKRLQLVQAKQVERHLHQQLGGLVEAAFGHSADTPRSRLTVVTRKAESQRRGEAGSTVSEAFLRATAPELERLRSSGTATLRACERGFDSDATESSSGGDSDIEEEELARKDTHLTHVPLKRRCEWTWAQERADVVSRWNWLQAHVSDLEYRIRQHTDFYRQLRAGKGQVLLDYASPSENCAGDTSHPTVDGRTALSASPSLDTERKAESGTTDPKMQQKPINGVVLPQRSGSSIEDQTSSKPAATASDSSCVCARTRPVLHCKRRRVVRPDRILPLHRKVQCSIPRPCEVASSCVMCASHPGCSTQFPYNDPLSDRLTLMDPAIHPVLSFPADVPASLRLNALLRSHNKLDRLKSIKKLKQRPPNQVSSSPEVPRTDRMPGIFHTHKITLHKPLPELPPKQHLDPLQRTLKCERSPASKSERSVMLSVSHKKRHFSPLERDGRHELDAAGPSLVADIYTSPSQAAIARQLPTSSESASLSAAAAAARKRRLETSYDIDNIVIPMSVAATTRVERLQYKEILTPSWRVVKITPLTPSSEEDLDEDLSDAAFTALHGKCEEMERARWATGSMPPQRRATRTHRTSESSGSAQLSIGAQPLTPQPPSPDTCSWQAMADFSPLSPDVLSAPPTPTSRDTPRLISEETQSSMSDSGYEEATVQPWERRHFPLSYHPKTEVAVISEPTDWGGPRPSRRASCSSRTAKDTEKPPSSPPCPSPRPRPLHR